MSRRIAALAITAIALLSAAGCTASPGAGSGGSADAQGDGGQTTAEACALVQDTIESATTEFEEGASADPSTIADGMTNAADKLAQLEPKVTNDAVAAILPDIRSLFDKTGKVVAAIVEGDVSKSADMAELGASLQGTMEKFQGLCGA